MAKNRFGKEPGDFGALRSLLLPIGSFVLVFGLFLGGLSSVGSTTEAQRQQSLVAAIRRSAVHCYATEGVYPDTLDYLVSHYGIRYDEEKYLIDYRIFASNLMPEITIIPR